MTRWNQLLLIVLIAQVALAIGLNLPENPVNSSSGPLLAGYTVDAVDEVKITDNNGVEVVLAKMDGGWVMAEADNYPAQASNIEDVLDGIAGITTDRLIARNPTSHRRLEVKDDSFQRRITLKQGDQTDTIYVGSSAGASATHVRLDDDNTVYLTDSLTAWNVPATISHWVDTTYFTQPRANFVEVTVKNSNGVFEFIKEGGEWMYQGIGEGETFDTNSIDSLFTNIANVRMTRPIGKDFDMSEPLATVTLTVEVENNAAEVTPEPNDGNGATAETVTHIYTLQLGPQIEGSTDYALSASESEYYVQVQDTWANTLIDLSHDSLLLVDETESE